MAEGFLNKGLQDRGIHSVRVESSGVAGWDGSPPAPEAALAVGEYGLDITLHRARRLTRPMVDWAELVLGMSAEHRDAVIRLNPRAERRTFTLKELVHLLESASPIRVQGSSETQLQASVEVAAAERAAGGGATELLDEDIADPLGLSIESFRAVAWELEDLSRRLMDGLFPGTRGATVRSEQAEGIGGRAGGEGGVG